MRIFVLALVGLVAGMVVGALAFFFAALLIVDWLHVSCFEGHCSFVAAYIGLVGLVLGGFVGAIWLGRIGARR